MCGVLPRLSIIGLDRSHSGFLFLPCPPHRERLFLSIRESSTMMVWFEDEPKFAQVVSSMISAENEHLRKSIEFETSSLLQLFNDQHG